MELNTTKEATQYKKIKFFFTFYIFRLVEKPRQLCKCKNIKDIH